MKLFQSLVFIVTLTISGPLFSYNYLYTHPETGMPIGWEPSSTIQYWLDPGPWGSLTNDQARILIQEAMKIWENISPTASVPKFEFEGYLPEDVNGSNYQKYVSSLPCYTDELLSCRSETQKNLQTVIIFDEGDVILNSELCRIIVCGANAGAKVFSGNREDPNNIVQGIAVLGSSSAGASINTIMGVLVHELGHLLGLAHSYLNQQSFGPQYFPTMMGIVPISGVTPTPDDVAGIARLYPSTSFALETATIKGQVLKSNDSLMMHVNVIARNSNDPLCESYSFLSGRICKHTTIGEVCIDDDGFAVDNGEYTLSGLPPGSYTLEVEEVSDESLAFSLAPGLVDPFIYGDAEFWNEGDAALDPSNLTSTIITLAAGETRENVDIVLNRSEVTEDRIKFIPLDTFSPGPGTRCPEEPPIDYAAMIGIDESNDDDGAASGGGSSTSSGGCSLIPY